MPKSRTLARACYRLTPDDVLASYPTLTLDDIKAAVAYGAELARERVLDLPLLATG